MLSLIISVAVIFGAGVFQGEAETIKFKGKYAWFNGDWWLEKLRPKLAENLFIKYIFSFFQGGFHLMKSLGLVLLIAGLLGWIQIFVWYIDVVIIYIIYSLGFLMSYHDWFGLFKGKK